jgi:hypothetical protein
MRGNRLAAGQPPNRTAFKPGLVPWNAGRKGIHLSPATEFKPGRPDFDRKPLGHVSIRRRKKDCGPRAWVKVAEPNRWRLRAGLVWESVNGPIPVGKIIHHQNRDTLDDAIANLRCLTKAEHLLEHWAELLAGRWLAGSPQCAVDPSTTYKRPIRKDGNHVRGFRSPNRA